MGKKPQALNNSTSLSSKKNSAHHLSKKEFRDNLAVEQFYKTLKKYDLREEAYKTAIQIYLDLKK